MTDDSYVRSLRAFCGDPTCPCVENDAEPCDEWVDGQRRPGPFSTRCARCGHAEWKHEPGAWKRLTEDLNVPLTTTRREGSVAGMELHVECHACQDRQLHDNGLRHCVCGGLWLLGPDNCMVAERLDDDPADGDYFDATPPEPPEPNPAEATPLDLFDAIITVNVLAQDYGWTGHGLTGALGDFQMAFPWLTSRSEAWRRTVELLGPERAAEDAVTLLELKAQLSAVKAELAEALVLAGQHEHEVMRLRGDVGRLITRITAEAEAKKASADADGKTPPGEPQEPAERPSFGDLGVLVDASLRAYDAITDAIQAAARTITK